MNVLAVCAGVGGLELGVKLASDAKVVCYVERDAFAASVIVARMGEEALDKAPVWSNLFTFDGTVWSGKVDCVAGGIPCQPWSQAGKKRGEQDERDLWPQFLRILGETNASMAFIENVPGFISGGGLARLLGDLADLGFNAEWGVFSNAQMGAPHIRKRVFILAYASGPELEGRPIQVPLQLQTASRGGLQIDYWPPAPGEWKDNWPMPAIEPPVCRSVDGSAGKLDPSFRADRLRVLGNAVSPIVAAIAWTILNKRRKI